MESAQIARNTKNTIGFQIDRDLEQQLRDEAWKARTTLSAFIREIVITGLEQRQAAQKMAEQAANANGA